MVRELLRRCLDAVLSSSTVTSIEHRLGTLEKEVESMKSQLSEVGEYQVDMDRDLQEQKGRINEWVGVPGYDRD